MSENKQLQVKNNVGDQVIARLNSLCEAGFTMPKDYSYVNAIKMSMIKLQDIKDKNGKKALDVCTPQSIQAALFEMVTKGLNLAFSQCSMVVRGNVLCFDVSYYGKVLMVKRIYPNWNPNPVVVREDDVFVYSINPDTGMKHLVRHEQKLENIDKNFVGGYMYLPTGNLYVMTRKQILTAWSKSPNKEQTVHKQFDEKMVMKTLISTGCNIIINTTPEYHVADDENQATDNDAQTGDGYDDFEDAEFVEEDVQTQEQEQSQEQEHPQEQNNDAEDEF